MQGLDPPRQHDVAIVLTLCALLADDELSKELPNRQAPKRLFAQTDAARVEEERAPRPGLFRV